MYVYLLKNKDQKMKKIISANNITEETIKASGEPDRYKNVPDAKTLSDAALEKGKKTIDKDGVLNKWEKPREPKDAKGRLTRIFNSIPRNFKLVTVLYTKISKQQNDAIAKEFSNKVKPRFLRFLAKKHAEDLKKLGICDHGIQRMHKGLDPADDQGRLYNVNIDHVIERAGSGRLGLEKSQDPHIPEDVGETFKVNHFNNLMLMTYPVHMGQKNLINDSQDLYNARVGKSQWVTMMIPIRSEDNKKFVFVPDNMDKHVKGAILRPETFDTRIGHLKFTLGQLLDGFDSFIKNRKVHDIISKIKHDEKTDRKFYFKVMRGDSDELREKRSEFTSLFNEAMKDNRREKKYHDERLVSLASDTFDLLEEIYETASKKGVGSEEWKKYTVLLNNSNYGGVVKKLFIVPSQETEILRERYKNLRDNVNYTIQTGKFSKKGFGR